jgi:ADP-ribosyl-[dinitrogen reductase] hydrolase
MKNRLNNIEGCFLGLAIGDALGVPVEFSNRRALKSNPVTTMVGYGTWHQPPGTWSDDSSLTFCLAESLANGYNIDDIGERFVKWMKQGYWGAHNAVFDIGGTTRIALQRVAEGENPLYSGELAEDSNGNGSLMRIAPAALYFHSEKNDVLLEKMREISGITHRHFRSVFSCFIFSKLISRILAGEDKIKAYHAANHEINDFIKSQNFYGSEVDRFRKILGGTIMVEEENAIYSTGYVLHTLEASIWSFLTTNSYREAVLKSVNLGEDTDTTACVTGALAGLYYGEAEIPVEWKNQLARKNDIITLARNFQNQMNTMILAKS